MIIVSDFDPEGDDIAHSFARSMRDDFGIEDIVAIKGLLRHDQVSQWDLPTDFDAKPKPKSSRYQQFVSKYGKGQNVYELEALAPQRLQSELTKVIDQTIDTKAFNAELEAERMDARKLQVMKEQVVETLSDWDVWLKENPGINHG